MCKNKLTFNFIYLLSTHIEGANGEGVAIVSSLSSFDRELQKEYLLPIVIKDSGTPSKTGTSTLTVIVGDVNDNMMLVPKKLQFITT